MAASKVAVTVDAQLLQEVDRWVAAGEFPSRSRVVQEGLERLRRERNRRTSLLGELAKLDLSEEQAFAEEHLVGEVPWPEY